MASHRRRLVPLLLFPTALAQTIGIVCHGIGGQSYVNNTRCPGSNACCGVKATCLSNRLCHNPGDGPELWVRGPCAVEPFDETCAQICLYDEVKTGGGVLPRVTPCADGSLCCNNDPQCCSKGAGVFLDENGNRVAARVTAATTSYPPLGTGTERFTLTPSSSSTVTTSTQTSAAPTTTTTGAGASAAGVEENVGLGVGGKVGLGVGIPIVVLAVGALGFWLFKRRSRRNAMPAVDGAGPNPGGYTDASGPGTVLAPPYGKDHYAPDLPSKASYPVTPVELGSANVAEMGTDSRRQPRYELS